MILKSLILYYCLILLIDNQCLSKVVVVKSDEFRMYLNKQISLSKEWKSGDELPNFVTDTSFDNIIIDKIEGFSGIMDVAIIEHINNKDLLIRLMTGCEKELSIPFALKIPQENRWDIQNRLFKYYLNLNIRFAAYRKYQKTFSTVALANHLNQVRDELEDCKNEYQVFYVDGNAILNVPIRKIDPKNKYIEGFIYYVGLRDVDEGNLVFSTNDDSFSYTSSAKLKDLNEIEKVMVDPFKTSWEQILSIGPNDYLFNKIDKKLKSIYDEKLVRHYIGPYFELNQESYIEKKLIQEALKLKEKPPIFLSKTINGYSAIIFIENIY